MFGIGMTFEDLCEFLQLKRGSSSPTPAADLNPKIQQLLTKYSMASIYGIGGRSVVIAISSVVVAKVSLRPGDPHMAQEQTIFELLEQKPCPHIVRSFLRRPDLTFMQLLGSGTLDQRMSLPDTSRPIRLWMQQLSAAAAWLESQGYAHGDLCPRNILFDEKDHLKLVDFDHALPIGANLEVGYEPYVRGRRQGEIGGGRYGTAGPTTEQFALGSIFWYMARGMELYFELEGAELVSRLVDGIFPDLDPVDPIELIIRDCWHERFPSIAGIAGCFQGIAAITEGISVV